MKWLLTENFIGSVARHGGTTLGGALLATGLADGDTATQVGGAVTVLLGFGLSLAKRFIL